METEQEGRNHEDFYLNLFEQRLEALMPYWDSDSKRDIEGLGEDELGGNLVKLISTVLYQPPQIDSFEILILDRKYSGYKQGDHEVIYSELKIDSERENDYLGFVLVNAAGRRYLLLRDLSKLVENDILMKSLVRTAQRYQLEKIINIEKEPYMDCHKVDIRIIEPILIDRLLFNDWSVQVAQTYGLTVTQWLRFKLTGELPR